MKLLNICSQLYLMLIQTNNLQKQGFYRYKEKKESQVPIE